MHNGYYAFRSQQIAKARTSTSPNSPTAFPPLSPAIKSQHRYHNTAQNQASDAAFTNARHSPFDITYLSSECFLYHDMNPADPYFFVKYDAASSFA